MRPEDAVAHARAEVERLKSAGRYGEADEGLRVEALEEVSRAQLLEWALIEPDVTQVRSTRRAGASITWVKRLLLRGLRQYHDELTSQQTRFNVHLLQRVLELENRIQQLEKRP